MTHKTTLICFLFAILVLVGIGCAAPNSNDQYPLPATETPSLPAESPTPEIEYTSPKFFSIPDQIFLPGEDSLTIDLAEDVYNADPASDLVSWHADSGPGLTADFNGPVIEIARTSPPPRCAPGRPTRRPPPTGSPSRREAPWRGRWHTCCPGG